MKNIRHLWFIFGLLLPSSACVIYADSNFADNPKGEGNEKHYVNMEIIFEDQELTETIKAQIRADYMSVLDSLKPKGRRDTHAKKIRVNDADITLTSYLLFTANYISYPGDYKDEYGRIGRINNGGEVLFISQTLSESYKAAIALIDVQKDAFESLPEFIRMLNGIDPATLLSVDQCVYFYGNRANEMTAEMNRSVKSDADLRDQYNAQFIAEYSAYSFEGGSILDYCVDNERLHTKIFILDKSSGEHKEEMYAVYDQERWKLLIPVM